VAVRRTWVDLGYGPRRFPAFRLSLARAIARTLILPFFRLRIEGLERLPDGSSVVCFNHLNWLDPIVLMAAMPANPRLYFFGPKEPDMGVGFRNRLMRWAGNAVAYQPGNRDMVTAVRRVGLLMESGAALAIAGEGRIFVGESAIRPLSEGPAFLALRTGVPVVPVAINGTGWLGFGRRIRVRIGEPVATAGLDRRRAGPDVTAQVRRRLGGLVADAPDLPPPGATWQRITELFNDWPEGARPAVERSE
jgi:1-acyl-sn-glycerol-3-phosphate acyltransferase